jgi:hypothetical protein
VGGEGFLRVDDEVNFGFVGCVFGDFVAEEFDVDFLRVVVVLRTSPAMVSMMVSYTLPIPRGRRRQTQKKAPQVPEMLVALNPTRYVPNARSALAVAISPRRTLWAATSLVTKICKPSLLGRTFFLVAFCAHGVSSLAARSHSWTAHPFFGTYMSWIVVKSVSMRSV